MELTELKEEIRSVVSEEISEGIAHALAEAQKPATAKELEDTHGEEKVSIAKEMVTWFKAIYDHEILGKVIADEILQTGVNIGVLYR